MAVAASAADRIAIEAFDLGFTPTAVSVPAAGTYDVSFHNTGATLHDVTFADGTRLSAAGGETATGTATRQYRGRAGVHLLHPRPR